MPTPPPFSMYDGMKKSELIESLSNLPGDPEVMCNDFLILGADSKVAALDIDGGALVDVPFIRLATALV